MSTPLTPGPSKLVTGILTRDKRLLKSLAGELSRHFGPIDMVSPWIPFDSTDYYREEMGGPLFRRLLAFEAPVRQDALARIKTLTNGIERGWREGERRRVNIDPGYLLLERFVLATGKNFAHRLYIGMGIYADLTLVYQGDAYRGLPWTYPDYAAAPVMGFLSMVRHKFQVDLKRVPDLSDRPFCGGGVTDGGEKTIFYGDVDGICGACAAHGETKQKNGPLGPENI